MGLTRTNFSPLCFSLSDLGETKETYSKVYQDTVLTVVWEAYLKTKQNETNPSTQKIEKYRATK